MPRNILNKDGEYVEVSGHVNDLTGRRFGRLSVIGLDYIDSAKNTRWYCKCDCGNSVSVRSHGLVSGGTKSCGCYKREVACFVSRKSNTVHGLTNKHKLYGVWKNIRQRCTNPNNPSYKNYGGRGISMSEEWDEYPIFLEWAMENGYKEGLTIERIDNDGDYSPDNCTFVDNVKQQRNRRKTIMLTYRGETRALSEWCEQFGLKLKTCYGRMHYYGWSDPHEILFGKGGA